MVASASAEPVRLMAGDEFGQGWLFKDPDTGFCGVVTAAHVVQASGKTGRVIIRRSGVDGGPPVESWSSDVQILSPARPVGLDIALIRVSGAILAGGCTSSTLGYSAVPPTFEAARQGLLSIYDRDDVLNTLAMTLDAEDKVNTDILAFEPEQSTLKVEGGFSGGAIVMPASGRIEPGRAGLPVAMVLDWNGATGQAVRWNAVARFVRLSLGERKTPDPTTSRGMAPVEVLETGGLTSDVNCPPTNLIKPSAACGWKAHPAGNGQDIQIVLGLGSATVSMVSISIATQSGSGTGGVTVEVAQGRSGDDWTWITHIPVEASATTTARFQPVYAGRLRLTIPAHPGETAEIRITQIE